MKKNKNKNKNIIIWAVAIFVALLCLVMFEYIDLKSLIIWSTNYLDVIAKGDITQYYAYTSLNLFGCPHQYVSGTLYSLMLWGIWNVPIWVLQYFFNIDILSHSLSLIWAKLFLSFALTITLIYTYKLVLFLTNKKNLARLAVFLSFSFLFTYVNVFYAGQNDILICMFGIMAIYYLIKSNNKNNIWFFIFSSLAISVKYFFFIPFLLIMLLTEKNILKIILKVIIVLIPTLLFNIVISDWPMYAESVANTGQSHILHGLISNGFPALNGINLSLFGISYLFLAIIAYFVPIKDEKEKNKYLIYLVSAAFISLMMFTNQNFYRPILCMPFMFILFVLNEKHLRNSIIIELIASFFLFISISTFSYYLFNSEVLSSFFNQNFNLNYGDFVISPHQFLENNFPNYMGAIATISSTIYFGLSMLLLIINYPKANLVLDGDNKKCEKYILYLRPLILLPLLIYILSGFFR